MKPNYTDITLIVDKSGSMEPLTTDTIGGINTFIDAQRKVPGTATFTLVQFNARATTVLNAVPMSMVENLSRTSYVPSGTTALLDAVGETITNTGKRLAALPEADRPSKVIVLIVTDGEENASREYRLDQIKTMIERQTKDFSWEFQYIGANQDAFKGAASMGINWAFTANYNATAKGTAATYQTMANSVMRSRARGAGASAAFTPDEQANLANTK